MLQRKRYLLAVAVLCLSEYISQMPITNKQPALREILIYNPEKVKRFRLVELQIPFTIVERFDYDIHVYADLVEHITKEEALFISAIVSSVKRRKIRGPPLDLMGNAVLYSVFL